MRPAVAAFLGRHLGWAIGVSLVVVVVVWLALAISGGPRAHVHGRLKIATASGQPCAVVESDEAGGPLWTIAGLPAGYAVVAESFDPRFEPGAGQIVGPDGRVIRYLDVVDLQGVPLPAVSDDPCGFNRRVSVTSISGNRSGP